MVGTTYDFIACVLSIDRTAPVTRAGLLEGPLPGFVLATQPREPWHLAGGERCRAALSYGEVGFATGCCSGMTIKTCRPERSVSVSVSAMAAPTTSTQSCPANGLVRTPTCST